MNFEELNLSKELMDSIKRLGFTEPTQIQAETIPLILTGKDVIGESATGSGKTLAFGAGIIEHSTPGQGIQALVLVPTRELAEQVKDDMVKISHHKKLRILAIYGGVSINPQMNQLKKADVVIATPGRLLDHLNRRTINTSKIKIFILDEADRMVEMGFIQDVEQIMTACPREKQTLLFSATMHGPAKQIAKKYMKDPITVSAVKMVDPTKLKQMYFEVPPNLKKTLMVHLLRKEESDLVMVFCNTRRATEMLVDVLKFNGIKSAPIHGGLTQVKRLKTIDLFNSGKFNVLVCTDVAARGLHIEGVSHVYNFDIPSEPGDYVHRIGRTARAGKEGKVINVLSRRDYDSFSRLLNTYREFEIPEEERPFLKDDDIQMPPKREYSDGSRNRGSRGGSRGRGNGGNNRRRKY